MLGLLARPAQAQQPRALTIEQALAAARRTSPDLAAAHAAAEVAAAQARQATARTNPTLSWNYERAAGSAQRNSQSIAALEQPLEVTGVLGARREAASLRRDAALAELRAGEANVGFDAVSAFAMALTADERLRLAERAAAAFDRAARVTTERLAAGDISGYEARRIRLESARYAALRAQAALARRSAYAALAVLVGMRVESLTVAGLAAPDSLAPSAAPPPSRDSLLAIALRRRPDVEAADRLAQAAAADARAERSARIPVPVVTAGWKTEHSTPSGLRLNGLVAGLSLPLPFWDRRAGAIGASQAEAQRRAALADGARRRVVREVDEAWNALESAQEEVARLGPALGPEAAAALTAAEGAYAEGEISLVEWLDAVRAYHEAESIMSGLRAELHIRRAALVRATGGNLFEERRP